MYPFGNPGNGGTGQRFSENYTEKDGTLNLNAQWEKGKISKGEVVAHSQKRRLRREKDVLNRKKGKLEGGG